MESSYAGPTLDKIEDLDEKWVIKLLEWMKDGKVLHKKFAIMIIMHCRDLFEKDKALVHIKVPDENEITVCGDIHG